MKIAQVIASDPPDCNRTAQIYDPIARGLARRGCEVHVFTGGWQAAVQELEHNLYLHRLRPSLPALFQAFKGFDLIHLVYPFASSEQVALAAYLRRIPLVVSLPPQSARGTSGRPDQRSGILERWAVHSAKVVLGAALNAAWTGELPLGIDTDAYSPGAPAPDLAQRYRGGPEDHLALLVAGPQDDPTGQSVLVFLQALAHLPASVKGLVLGDAGLQAGCQAAIQSFDLGGRVSFAIQGPPATMPAYYCLADVTVLPFPASGGNCDSAAIESLACGRPVIEGRQPGISPLVSDGKDGFLVDPGDASGLAEKLLFLISHAERRREMGQFGRFKVEARYSWPRAVDRLEKVYAGVLSGRLPAAAQALPFA